MICEMFTKKLFKQHLCAFFHPWFIRLFFSPTPVTGTQISCQNYLWFFLPWNWCCVVMWMLIIYWHTTSVMMAQRKAVVYLVLLRLNPKHKWKILNHHSPHGSLLLIVNILLETGRAEMCPCEMSLRKTS